jgi:hypothetical protein
MRPRALFLLGPLLLAAPAAADVTSSAPHALVVEHKLSSTKAPRDLFRALGQVGKWWNKDHTFSGSAANLSLKTEAGACFCERWKEGSVEHGRVIQTQRDRLLRLGAALGPLMDQAVTGVLTFDLRPRPTQAPQPGGTDLVVTYRVSGDPSHALASLAEPVNRVIGEQAARLVRFVETGKPE